MPNSQDSFGNHDDIAEFELKIECPNPSSTISINANHCIALRSNLSPEFNSSLNCRLLDQSTRN
jgi:hypothetical protein